MADEFAREIRQRQFCVRAGELVWLNFAFPFSRGTIKFLQMKGIFLAGDARRLSIEQLTI